MVTKRVSLAATLVAFALILIGNQNCSPVGFEGSVLSQPAPGTSISTTGIPSDNSNGSKLPLPGSPASPTPAPGANTQIPSSPGPGPFAFPLPVTSKQRLERKATSNSWCGGPDRKLDTVACSQVKGQGTSTAPFEVYTARDFACIEEAPDAYWNMKADVVIRPDDYQKPGGKRFIPIPCFGGVLDGEFHRLRHEIDCTKFDCTGEDNVGKDATLVGMFAGVFMNLHLEADFRNMKQPYKHYSQYASGIAVSAKDAVILRVDMRGNFDFQGQSVAGIFNTDSEYGSERTLLEQVQSEFKALQITSFQPQNTAGLVGRTGGTTISNSLSVYPPTEVSIGATRGGLTMFGDGSPTFRSSYHSGDFTVDDCNVVGAGLVQPIGTKGTVEGSFWNAKVSDSSGNACTDLSKVFQSSLQRNGAALTGVFDEFQFSTDYWVRGADGLPQLKWRQ